MPNPPFLGNLANCLSKSLNSKAALDAQLQANAALGHYQIIDIAMTRLVDRPEEPSEPCFVQTTKAELEKSIALLFDLVSYIHDVRREKLLDIEDAVKTLRARSQVPHVDYDTGRLARDVEDDFSAMVHYSSTDERL